MDHQRDSVWIKPLEATALFTRRITLSPRTDAHVIDHMINCIRYLKNVKIQFLVG
jgi:hypothetical protein